MKAQRSGAAAASDLVTQRADNERQASVSLSAEVWKGTGGSAEQARDEVELAGHGSRRRQLHDRVGRLDRRLRLQP